MNKIFMYIGIGLVAVLAALAYSNGKTEEIEASFQEFHRGTKEAIENAEKAKTEGCKPCQEYQEQLEKTRKLAIAARMSKENNNEA